MNWIGKLGKILEIWNYSFVCSADSDYLIIWSADSACSNWEFGKKNSNSKLRNWKLFICLFDSAFILYFPCYSAHCPVPIVANCKICHLELLFDHGFLCLCLYNILSIANYSQEEFLCDIVWLIYVTGDYLLAYLLKTINFPFCDYDLLSNWQLVFFWM